MPAHAFTALRPARFPPAKAPVRSEAFPEDLDHDLAYPRRYVSRSAGPWRATRMLALPVACALLGAAGWLLVA